MFHVSFLAEKGCTVVLIVCTISVDIVHDKDDEFSRSRYLFINNHTVEEQVLVIVFNPLPSGTLAAFFLTAVGPIQHTKEGDISREKTILMT